jgi:hypothetical protein
MVRHRENYRDWVIGQGYDWGGFEQPRQQRSREAEYDCFICGQRGRASHMTAVRSPNEVLYGPSVAVHKGLCEDKFHRRYG